MKTCKHGTILYGSCLSCKKESTRNYIEGLMLGCAYPTKISKRHRVLEVKKGFYIDDFYTKVELKEDRLINIFKSKRLKSKTWYHVFIVYHELTDSIVIEISKYPNMIDIYYNPLFQKYRRIGSILIHRKKGIKEILPFKQFDNKFEWTPEAKEYITLDYTSGKLKTIGYKDNGI